MGMTITDMLSQSALLTVLGMGVVFGFLIVMIIFMNITAKIIKKMGLDKDETPAKGSGAKKAPAQNTAAVVAAIATAAREKNV